MTTITRPQRNPLQGIEPQPWARPSSAWVCLEVFDRTDPHAAQCVR